MLERAGQLACPVSCVGLELAMALTVARETYPKEVVQTWAALCFTWSPGLNVRSKSHSSCPRPPTGLPCCTPSTFFWMCSFCFPPPQTHAPDHHGWCKLALPLTQLSCSWPLENATHLCTGLLTLRWRESAYGTHGSCKNTRDLSKGWPKGECGLHPEGSKMCSNVKLDSDVLHKGHG